MWVHISNEEAKILLIGIANQGVVNKEHMETPEDINQEQYKKSLWSLEQRLKKVVIYTD